MFNPNDKPSGMNRIYLASLNSMRALSWLIKNEAAFKQEVLLLTVSLPVVFLFNIDLGGKLTLIAAVMLVILIEIINTAIETVVDRIGLENNQLSGLAKDLGSAAVFVSLVIAFLIWIAILL